jgi:photosystem II stability/assembly factor-like uncharacterized protein
MRTFVRLLALALASFAASGVMAQQWIWQSPLPQGNPINTMQILPSGVGWAGGRNVLMKTTNSGNTWTVVANWQNGTIKKVQFLNPDNGWLLADNGDWNSSITEIYRTFNGGRNWQRLVRMTNLSAADFYMLNAGGGILIGDSSYSGRIYRTTDGGASWSRRWGDMSYGSLASLSFVNPLHGWAVGDSRIVETHDAGVTWSLINDSSRFSDGQFVNDSVGYAVDFENVYRTDDGGHYWQNMFHPGFYLYHVRFVNSFTGWAFGYASTIIKTTDCGITWTAQMTPAHNSVNNLYCRTAEEVMLSSNWGEILLSHTGGLNWTLAAGQRATAANLSRISFADSLHGFAAGNDYVNSTRAIVHTADGGRNWTEVFADAASFLCDVQSISAQEAWAIREDRSLLHTTDGGQNWTLTTMSGSNYGLIALQFVSPDTGFILGSDAVYRTTDHGVSWEAQARFMDYYYKTALYFTDTQNGWVGGGKPAVLMHTTDGGGTWERQYIDTLWGESVVMSICFTDVMNGWSTGLEHLIHTSDGGLTWHDVDTSPIDWPEEVYFSTRQDGWAAGYGGATHTTDGGQTWIDTHAPISISALHTTNPDFAWGVGSNGSIVYWHAPVNPVTPRNRPEIAQSCRISAYPNPFNPVTTLTFVIPVYGLAVVELFDLTGRHVQTIMRGNVQAGEYQQHFDGAQLPSGIYFARLSGTGYQTAIRLVLLK